MLITLKAKKNGVTIYDKVISGKRSADAEFRVLVKQCQVACNGVVVIKETFCGLSADITSLFDTFKVVTFECDATPYKIKRFRSVNTF